MDHTSQLERLFTAVLSGLGSEAGPAAACVAEGEFGLAYDILMDALQQDRIRLDREAMVSLSAARALMQARGG